MINANELRIGNWVQHEPYPDEKWKVDLRLLEAIDLQLVEVSPIPLTEEILLKCGFQVQPWGYSLGKYHISKVGWFMKVLNDDENVILNYHINHLHQLQNIYFALTGEELNIQL